MISLFRAEWEKTAGNRWAVSFFVWIVPVGVTIFMLLALFITLVSEEFRTTQRTLGIAPWDQTMLGIWAILNTEIGRMAMLAFAAIVFAGEYQYGTWKNLLPRTTRTRLIVTKFITIAVFLTSAYVAGSIVSGIGTGLIAGLVGVDYGLSAFGARLPDFLGDYGLQLFLTMSAMLIALGYASLAAMVTRSILGTLLLSFLIYLGEAAMLLPIFLLQRFLDINLIGLYLLTPGYNLANISSWVTMNQGYSLGDVFSAQPLSMSLLIVVCWMVGLIWLTAYLFRRQDIVS